MIPQLIFLVLYAYIIVNHASRHGKTELKTHNGTAAFFGALIGASILWWGNFWAPIGLPGPQ